MFMEQRQQEIAESIRAEGSITIGAICEKYAVSEESARRDLRMLEKNGLCQRTRGGAIRVQQVNVRPPAKRDFAGMPVWPTYREIAREAAKQIRENDVVYLTGGSFGYIMLPYLPGDFPYTLVVNNVELARELRFRDNVEVYVAGGRMRQSGSLVDALAAEFVSCIHFDLCFLTGGGFTVQQGLSNGTAETAAFQQAVMKNSRRRVLLMPGTKVGRNAFIRVCPAEDFDLILTDWDCVDEELNRLSDAGIEIRAVQEQP